MPVQSVFALVNKDRTRAVRGPVCHQRFILSVLFPYPGITEIRRTAAFRQVPGRKNRVLFIFCVIDTVSGSQALYLPVSAVLFPESGIHQQMTSVRQRECRSGETAVPVVFLRGRQRTGQVRPVHKVFCNGVAPADLPGLSVKQIRLIEQMRTTAKERKPVRIVDPAGQPGQVKCRPFCGIILPYLLFFKGSGLFQRFIHPSFLSVSRQMRTVQAVPSLVPVFRPSSDRSRPDTAHIAADRKS